MPTTIPTDPVCGLTVPNPSPDLQLVHEGTAYGFCGLECREKFHRNPELFIPRSRPPATGFLAKLGRAVFGGCCACHDPKPQPQEKET